MSTKNTMRVAIVVSWSSLVIGVIVSFWEESRLAAPLQEFLEAEYAQPLTPAIVVMVLLLLVLVAASVGLFVLARWARPLFLWTNLVALCMWPMAGPNVTGPWTTMFDEVSLMGFGFVIAVTYFGDLKEHFDQRTA